MIFDSLFRLTKTGDRENYGLNRYLAEIEGKLPVPKGQIAIARDFALVLNDNGHQTLIGDNDSFCQLSTNEGIVKLAATFAGYMALTRHGRIITSGKAREFERFYYVEMLSNVKDVVATEGHTVVLFDDGTVESIDESGGWEDIPQHHKVVKGWRDIKQVAVGFSNIMGLTEAGKVLYHSVDGYTNTHFYDNCSDVVQIDCCSYYYGTDSSAVLYKDGTVFSDTFDGVKEWSDIIQISVGDRIIVGLKRDGTIEIEGRKKSVAKEWKNLVSVECKFCRVVGITSSGEILSC